MNVQPILNPTNTVFAMSPKKSKRAPKLEGNERLKNWTALPKGMREFYKDTPLKTIIFRTSSKGTRIEVNKDDDLNLGYQNRFIWYFTFNKVNGRFGMLCAKEETWIYSTTDTGVME
jgi:peptidoglycan hydrolase-like protein with peptidoglycan-binding domain